MHSKSSTLRTSQAPARVRLPAARGIGRGESTDRLVEVDGVPEHAVHRRDARRVPGADVVVEGRREVEQLLHVGDVRGVPRGDGALRRLGGGAIGLPQFHRGLDRVVVHRAAAADEPEHGGAKSHG